MEGQEPGPKAKPASAEPFTAPPRCHGPPTLGAVAKVSSNPPPVTGVLTSMAITHVLAPERVPFATAVLNTDHPAGMLRAVACVHSASGVKLADENIATPGAEPDAVATCPVPNAHMTLESGSTTAQPKTKPTPNGAVVTSCVTQSGGPLWRRNLKYASQARPSPGDVLVQLSVLFQFLHRMAITDRLASGRHAQCSFIHL